MHYLIFAIISSVILGSHNYLVPNVINDKYTKETFIFQKEIFAVIILWLLSLWNPFHFHIPATIKEQPLTILFVIISGTSGAFMLDFYYKGLKLGKKGLVSAVVYSYIGGILIIGFIFAVTNFTFFGTYTVQTVKTYLFVLLIIIGILFLFLGKKNGDSKEQDHNKAMKSAVIAMLLYVIMFVAYGPVPAMVGALTAAAMGRTPLIPATYIFMKVRKQQVTLLPPKGNFLVVLGMGFIVAMSMLFMSLAFQTGDKGIVAAIYGTNPLITWVIALLKDKKEKQISIWQVIGFLMTIAGVVLISINKI